MVAVVADPEQPSFATQENFARWHRLTPSATWRCVNVPCGDSSRTAKVLVDMMESKRVRSGQLILLASGEVGRGVLEVVLRGALECAGVLAVDVPCAPLPFGELATHAAIRLVIHQGNEEEFGLVGQLQRADVDERVMRLNQAGATGSQATASAAETFLLELVAMVGHRFGI
ncbi:MULTISPECIES: hypothetical protein [unclassified Bradyrhizobium]|uniref:hypothetical protein n=1 Tax=unclassified Bradyrhizobium TaxID=2631580 RepID=UPI002478CAA0|nr:MULTISPECIES: hypothetical protein [unclassified Bradyrhizobium]WGR73777.1 hypothetical protein MTX24_13610 [Bradyrhizobium sp. ISRA426]WGR78615.1 hypothetical protein MTX21_38580 [Bradyrhizobium sp. ISRA430]WGR89016.1 hypothetical protein MTX25_13625 [Bradyrhizobium sp. ISRA432]